MQHLKPLRRYLGIQGRYAGDIATGPVEARDETDRHGIEAGVEDNRNCRGRRLGCECRGGTVGGDYGHLSLNQVGGQGWQSIIVVFRPPVFNRYILTFDKGDLVQALTERGHVLPGIGWRLVLEESNYRHWLLRTGGAGPRHRTAVKREVPGPVPSDTSAVRGRRFARLSRSQ